MVKVKLWYRRSYSDRRPWSEIVVPMSRISKAADIVALSDCGISVTSGERAQALVDFLRDAIDKNQDIIPEVKAVSRMGWNEEGFSPYAGVQAQGLIAPQFPGAGCQFVYVEFNPPVTILGGCGSSTRKTMPPAFKVTPPRSRQWRRP